MSGEIKSIEYVSADKRIGTLKETVDLLLNQVQSFAAIIKLQQAKIDELEKKTSQMLDRNTESNNLDVETSKLLTSISNYFLINCSDMRLVIEAAFDASGEDQSGLTLIDRPLFYLDNLITQKMHTELMIWAKESPARTQFIKTWIEKKTSQSLTHNLDKITRFFKLRPDFIDQCLYDAHFLSLTGDELTKDDDPSYITGSFITNPGEVFDQFIEWAKGSDLRIKYLEKWIAIVDRQYS